MEYELLDTGVFNDDRYFDVFVEYAKGAPEDILVQHHGGQPRTGRGRPASPADAVVPQRLVGLDCRVQQGRPEAPPASVRGAGRRQRGRR